ncbi:ribosomal protein S16 domain-containing protein [Aspergillus unguis]
MVVRIRLARFGNKHKPFYNIVVAQARSARDSKPLEVIGTLNPIPQRPTNLSDQEARTARPYKEISLDRSRAKYWIGVGAQPSGTVWRLLSMAGLVHQKDTTQKPKKESVSASVKASAKTSQSAEAV